MTTPTPRPEHGADDQWAAELHAMALDIEAVHRGPAYHADDVCLCAHTYSDHAPGPCDPPRGACGCLRYRDAWTADDSYAERMADAATPEIEED